MTALRPGTDFETFIRENTAILAPPHVPELRLHLADEAHDLWHRTAEELGALGLPPPFWAFAWAGGQGLARHILAEPHWVRGQRVLDFAAGSGLVGIAAAKAGAASVTAVDIDPFAITAIGLNADLNDVEMQTSSIDLLGDNPDTEMPFDVILAGDIWYDRQMSDQVTPWLRCRVRNGATVLVGDPGRAYRPTDNLRRLALYEVPVSRALEDSEVKRTAVWQVL
ncbi:class I SAM-dependent methyltransferase [Pseudohoeflea coraliihabitans]|uniref:Methyltransferase n=1 Tax=Pseudohoeflea coraliihabitans TaxID=2860393 RepID=A0ABS6WLI1_9HYPH|nr:methyltransferase [Pseudohoeflea sp. DP4N28-3]MBW3096796.1 methyltransferase [Pseudohoeflea sp. DP4N28-3]